MELRHLRYFIAVAEHENVRAASAQLHVTQPAVSRQIQDLEEQLKLQLFARTPRGLKLTPAGAAFLRSARETLESLDTGIHNARMIADGLRGELRIGLVEIAGWDGIAPISFGRFQQAVPDVGIRMAPLNTPEQLTAIEAGRLDGGFVYLFDPLPAQLEAVPLTAHDVVLAVPSIWDAPPETYARARDLSAFPFITFQRPVYPAYYDRLLGTCSRAGLTLKVVQEMMSEAAVLSLVSAGIGIAFVNNANRARPPARVRFIDVADVSVPLPLSFVYRREHGNPILARFLQTLDDARGEVAAAADPSGKHELRF